MAVFAALACGGACQTPSAAGPALPFGVPQAAEERAAQDAARATTLFDEGAAELARGEGADVRRAEEAFRRAAQLEPELALAHYNLGVLAEARGDAGAAERSYRRALDIDPKLDLAADNLGRMWEARGKTDDAHALYEKSLAQHPEAVGPRLRLARALRARGEPQKAAVLAREALQFDATSLEAYRMLARLYAENQKGQLARLIALRGQKLAPRDPELHYSLGLVAEQEGKLADARALWVGVVQQDGTHLEARRALAALSLRIRDWHTAAAQLEALVAAGQRHPSVWVGLGVARKGRGDFPGAREAYLKAFEQEGAFAPALLNLAVIELRHLDQPADARVHLERYLDLTDVVEPAAQLLEEARVMVEAKRQEEAMLQRMAEAAAEPSPTGPEAAVAAEPTGESPMASAPPTAGGSDVPASTDPRASEPEGDPAARDDEPAGRSASSPQKPRPRKRPPASDPSPPPSSSDTEESLFD